MAGAERWLHEMRGVATVVLDGALTRRVSNPGVALCVTPMLWLVPSSVPSPRASPPPQWMWAALNLGALGTFALTFFSDDKFPFRLIVTGTAWTLGLVSALYGLRQFHRRRRALLTNTLDPAKWESPAAPGAVIAIFAVVVAAVVIYAAASGYSFALRKPGILNPKILDRDE